MLELTLDEFDKRIRQVLLDDDALKDVARLTRDDVHKWYRDLPEDYFDNPEPYPDGTPRHGRARSFMYPLTTAWQYETIENGFSVFFKHGRGDSSYWGLRLQQYGSKDLPGGAITPVKKRALTIPVTSDAHGRSTREFEQATGKSLFLVGKEEGDKLGTLAYEDENGFLHAAYVLRTRSVVPSLKERRGYDAIPTHAQFAMWTKNNFVKSIKDILKS